MCAEFALKEGGVDPSGFLHQDYVGRGFERLVTKRHVAVGEVIVRHSPTDLGRHAAKRPVDVHIVQRPALAIFTANCPAPWAALMRRWRDGR